MYNSIDNSFTKNYQRIIINNSAFHTSSINLLTRSKIILQYSGQRGRQIYPVHVNGRIKPGRKSG
jgi:hypothetical protein